MERIIEFEGRAQTIRAWSAELGVGVAALWSRLRRGRDFLKRGRIKRDGEDVDRFVNKVVYDDNCGCWLWTGASFVYGERKIRYGQFFLEGKRVKAYRWSYEFLLGPIPEEGENSRRQSVSLAESIVAQAVGLLLAAVAALALARAWFRWLERRGLLPLPSMPAAGTISPDLRRAIEAHKEAIRAYNAACERARRASKRRDEVLMVASLLLTSRTSADIVSDALRDPVLAESSGNEDVVRSAVALAVRLVDRIDTACPVPDVPPAPEAPGRAGRPA